MQAAAIKRAPTPENLNDAAHLGTVKLATCLVAGRLI